MFRQRKHILYILSVSIIVSVLSACSTQKNTSSSRFWHSFTARYNTYFNGSQAYIEGSLAKENGNKDNYTELIPLYTVGNKASRELGKGNFETAITKSQKAIKQHSIKKRPEWTKNRKKTEQDLEWLNRREYNPFIWKAWMLMGRSQFHSGSFDEAAATFSYMSRLYRTQPAIYGKARAWLAKCYIEQDWIYDAEDVIRNIQRDSIDRGAQKEWDYTLADYYLHTGELDKSADYLRKVIKHEMRSKQRAREWYLLGQVYAALHDNTKAYDAFRHCIRQSPPYELEFNARISMTEVMPAGAAKSKIARLRRMAHSDKNKDYLEQVYYAMGNIYLAEHDTINAIGAYEQGNKKATRTGIEKGVLLLHLGDLYWAKEKFGDARRCYGEAIGLLDKDRPDYQQLSMRSKILDELAPHTDAVFLQDSLQALAKMSEKDRNAAIDRVIDELKKKEKEERLNKLEAEVQKNNQNSPFANNAPTTPTAPGAVGNGQFYFYNPTAVQQGKAAFQKQWGKRENTDDWQRMNRSVVADESMAQTEEGGGTDNVTDSLSIAGGDSEVADSTANKDALDPHKREYYLAQIPFTEEQLAASNAIIADGLYNSGIIFKDKLDNLVLSEKALVRLNTSFPEFDKTEDVYYHLFLLYSRLEKHQTAKRYKDLLAKDYADGKWSQIVNDPYFVDNARYGTHREDSLYAETYDAFCSDNYERVARNGSISEHRYPLGEHRDKFLFIGGLTRLNMGDADSCLNAMQRVVKEFPKSDVAALAGMIINGVKDGKKLRSAKFDISDIWNYRSNALSESEDTTEQHFSDDPLLEHVFLMTYNPDSIAENQLLYELARHNFTSYLIRNFDIDIEDFGGMHRLMISGFNNHDEALVYARDLYRNARIMNIARGCRTTIISKQNLALLGTHFSYNEYDEFYHTNMPHPLPDLGPESPLNEPVVDPEMYNPENQPAEPQQKADAQDDAYPINNSQSQQTIDDDFIIPEEPKVVNKNANDDGFIIPEEAKSATQKVDDNTFTIPEETKATTKNVDDNTFAIPDDVKPENQKTNTPVKQNDPASVKQTSPTPTKQNTPAPTKQSTPVQTKQNTPVPVKQKAATVRQDINASVLEIIDEDYKPKTSTEKKPEKKKETQQQKNDDEYFELEGF